jgi:Na+/H+ antiporter NhaC
LVLPILGMIAVGIPMYYLVKPGQPNPLDWFPYAALIIIVISVLYSLWLVRRDPGVGDRVGSIVADE